MLDYYTELGALVDGIINANKFCLDNKIIGEKEAHERIGKSVLEEYKKLKEKK